MSRPLAWTGGVSPEGLASLSFDAPMRVLMLLLLAGLACRNASQLSPQARETIRLEVEAALRDAYDLSRPGVMERMLALYPDSAAVVSANSGRLVPRDSLEAGIRYFWNYVGVNMRNPSWVWDSLHTDVLSRDAAAVTATYRIPHRNPRGEPHVLGGAMTLVLRKRDGRWEIIQEHLSDLPQGLQDTTDPSTGH
jgi:ketosteroid isomerase-like protein